MSDKFTAANALHQAGKLDEAEAAYRAILAESPHDGRTRHLLGMIFYQRGDFEEAIKLVDEAMQDGAVGETALFNRAMVLEELNRIDEARVIYDHLLTVNPLSYRAFRRRFGERIFGLWLER
jgi:protein O-GlcNAc transferase